MARLALGYLVISLPIGVALASGLSKQENSSQNIVPAAKIANALEDLTRGANAPGGSALYTRSQSAFHKLSQLPQKQVVPAVVEGLQADERFRGRAVRRARYGLLAVHHAETTPIGREQLFAGLKEPDAVIQVRCAEALANASHEIRTEAVALLGAQLDDSALPSRIPSKSLVEALQRMDPLIEALGKLGEAAKPFVEDIERIFVDTELDFANVQIEKDPPWTSAEVEYSTQARRCAEAGKALRLEAAHAMVRIGGIEYVLEYLGNHDLDPADEWLLVAAVASGVHEANETDEMPPVMRQKILHLVLKHMRNVHKDIREQALQVLFFLLWDKVDVFIIRAPNAYELNPIVKEAVDNMAANDPDEVLRRTAAGTLEQLDLNKVERILRSRQQEQEKKPQGNE